MSGLEVGFGVAGGCLVSLIAAGVGLGCYSGCKGEARRPYQVELDCLACTSNTGYALGACMRKCCSASHEATAPDQQQMFGGAYAAYAAPQTDTRRRASSASSEEIKL